MTLHLHRAPRTDLLADELGDLLARPLEDPFATELVLVPARGVERWLSQRLSHRLGRRAAALDGVCAGVEFRSPRSLVAELTGTVHDDPWAPDALAWPLLEVHRREPRRAVEPHARPAPRPPRHRRRGGVPARAAVRRRAPARRPLRVVRRAAAAAARRLARRPARPTGSAATLDDDLAWQPRLWRALVARVGAPPPHVRHAEAVAPAARRGARPARPALAVRPHPDARHRDRAARARSPTPTTSTCGCRTPATSMWRALPARGRPGAAARGPQPPPGRPPAAGHARPRRPRAPAEPGGDRGAVDHHHEGPPPPDTLLGWLQADLRARTPCVPQGRVLAAGRPLGPGALLPRRGPPGRRAARGAARAAPGRPDPRAARHPRDVPRHRDLRAADHRGLRPR